MFVSVLIPTFNEQDNIKLCIQLLLAQSHKEIEIIVIDDGSTDKTLDIVKQFKGVKILTQNHGGPARARNLGASIAKGKILIFLDADMFAHPDFIKKSIKPIISNKVKGTFPKNELVFNKNTFFGDGWAICSDLPMGYRIHPDHPEESGVFRALLKSEFNKTDGFAETRGVGEDFALSEQLGYKAINANDAIVYHSNPANFHDTFKSAKWYGKGWYYPKSAFGKLKGLIKFSLPISILKGSYESFLNNRPFHLFYRIIFDFSVTAGIISSFLIKNDNELGK